MSTRNIVWSRSYTDAAVRWVEVRTMVAVVCMDGGTAGSTRSSSNFLTINV